MKAYAKILGVVLVGLPIQIALAAGEKSLGDDLIARAFTVTSNTDSLVARAFTATSNTDSLVARAFTATSNTDSLVARAFTAVNCEEGAGGLCADCDGDDIPDECELDCGADGGPCDLPDCGLSVDCNDNGVPDECDPDCDGDTIPDECEITDCPPGDPDCADCNDNGIPDACDIANKDSSDILGAGALPDGVPDECQSDCNGNLIPDELDISDCPPEDVSCQDCNGNGIPDECELPISSGGICTKDCDPDCDENGILDECDIANCAEGELDCNDCNLNGVPDVCDDPEDSSPDECVEYIGECLGGDPAWSCPENWDLSDDFPDNGAEASFSVILAGSQDDVVLDVSVEIDTLLLLDGAVLNIPQDGGDLTIVEPGGVFSSGSLLIDDGRTIDAPTSSFTVAAGGLYRAADGAAGLQASTLDAGSITILGGPLADGGEGAMVIDGVMAVISHGDMTMDAEGKGSGIPPDLNVTGEGTLQVDGNFEMMSEVVLVYDSDVPLMLGGDFVNHSTVDSANDFDWLGGALSMTGGGGGLQNIEAAGEDLGPWPIGLVDNFAFGVLTIETGAIVEVVDTFDNQSDGVVACDEALYVSTLVAESGAVLITNGCKVYYEQLCDGNGCPGDIPGLGIDVLQIQEPPPADFNGDGRVGPFDLASLLANWGPCEGCPQDLNGDDVVGPFDLANLLAQWTSS